MYKRRGGAGGEAAADARYAYRASCPYLFMVLGGGCAIGADSWRGGGSESMYVRGVGVDGQPGTRTAAHLRRRLGDKDEMRTREACETGRRVQLAGKLAGLIPSREPKRCGRGRRQPASSVMRPPPHTPPPVGQARLRAGPSKAATTTRPGYPPPCQQLVSILRHYSTGIIHVMHAGAGPRRRSVAGRAHSPPAWVHGVALSLWPAPWRCCSTSVGSDAVAAAA